MVTTNDNNSSMAHEQKTQKTLLIRHSFITLMKKSHVPPKITYIYKNYHKISFDP